MKTKHIYQFRNVLKTPLNFLPGGRRAGVLLDRLADFLAFRNLQTENGIHPYVQWSERRFLDDSDPEKHFDAHYIYHTAWAARILSNRPPEIHYDFSSSLYFASIVSAFVPVVFSDYRPAKLNLAGYRGLQCDLLNLQFNNESLDSISCMHVLEHIGLGRYGDTLNPSGDISACNELQRVAKQGARVLVVVPVGHARIEFNAHRIYQFEQVLEMFWDCSLTSCSLLPDDSSCGLLPNAAPALFNEQRYGCGCFEFRKN